MRAQTLGDVTQLMSLKADYKRLQWGGGTAAFCVYLRLCNLKLAFLILMTLCLDARNFSSHYASTFRLDKIILTSERTY
jgi:hypothetical protein